MNMPGKCTEQKKKASIGRSRLGQHNRQTVRSSVAQKMFGICEAKNGTEIDELLQAGASRHLKSTAK